VVRIRVQIVDDQMIFRIGLRRLLEAVEGLEVVAESGTVPAAVDDAILRSPDVILLDLKLGAESGLTVVRAIRERGVQARILIVSAYDDFPLIEAAVAEGARGYVLKNAEGRELAQAIREVHSGGYYLHESLAASLMQGLQFRSRPVSPLTQEEQSLIRMLSSGLSYVDIAKHTFVNERTVRRHAQALYEKLGAEDRVQAVAVAAEKGWL